MFVIHTKNQPLDISHLYIYTKIIRSYPVLQYIIFFYQDQVIDINLFFLHCPFLLKSQKQIFMQTVFPKMIQ